MQPGVGVEANHALLWVEPEKQVVLSCGFGRKLAGQQRGPWNKQARERDSGG
jgi:hypothetical protein